MRIATILAALPTLIAGATATAQSRLIEQSGPFRHVGSNTTFPEQFGDFARARIVRYDDPAGEASAPAASGVPSGLSHRANYTFSLDLNGTPTTLQSQIVLYCYVGGNWFVKYRASSVPGVDLAGSLTRFITSGPWPGKKF